MKRYTFLLLFLVGTTKALAQQCLLTAPVAGSSWTVGTTMPIAWNTLAFTTNVNLKLIDYTSGGSGTVVLAIAGNIPNTGTYNWVIPTTLSPKCVYGVYVENIGRTNWCYGPNNICVRPLPLCCPEFKLTTAFIEACRGECIDVPRVSPHGDFIVACKNQPHTYLVTPNQTGYTYNWTITGGTPTLFIGNPAVITWGNGTQGTIQVIMSSADGQCRDTIKRDICLIDAPTAAFTSAPNPVCLNGSVCFDGTPSVGANSYYWDFGDGTSSTLQSPCHTYNPAGNYTVVLTVSGVVQDSLVKDCGCKDTARAVINVSSLTGIEIHSDCRKMLCINDTVTYCTNTVGCSSLTWSVNGGNIVSGQGSTCILVAWNQPSIYPTSVTLTAPNCPNTCGNSTTLNVPVLYPNLPIQGLNIVCPNTTATYSLPALPGTFYDWSISNTAGVIMPIDSNHNVITVTWGSIVGGPYILTCDYYNPYSGCYGKSTISVFIKPKFQVTGLSPVVCANTSATYNVSGGGGANFNWAISPTTGYTPTGTPPGTFLSQPNLSITSWNAAGNYTITATPLLSNVGNYCNASSTFNVLVNPSPVLNPIIGDIVVCPNQVYTYAVTSNINGGNYAWAFTSGTGTIAPYGASNAFASIIFTGNGPWTIEATQTVNGCSGKIMRTITKVPQPPSITLSASSVCSGGTITASVAGVLPSGGYTWSCTAGGVLTAGQGTTGATFTINSNATITVSSCGGSRTINVVATLATVSLTQTLGVCGATLTASPNGGTYTWYLNGNPTSVGSGNPFTALQNGNYVVQATYGTCVATASIAVTNINPVITNIFAVGNVCNGNSATLTATIPANCPSPVFTWFKVNTGNIGTGNPKIVSTQGSYYVVLTCSNGCSYTSNTISLSCGPPPPCLDPPCECKPDLVITPPSNCPNPVILSTNTPVGCVVGAPTTWWFGDDLLPYPTGTHLYKNVGIYGVYARMNCNGVFHCDTQIVTIPMVDSFTSVVTCGANGWVIQLQDASTFLPAYAGYSLVWSTTPCGILSSTTSANPTLTVPFGCNPTVTLTISKNGCTLSHSVNFNFPTTPLTILGPVPPVICRGDSNQFSSSFNPALTYLWNFGDATTGVTNPITHVYNGVPPNPTITLSVTDKYGCVFSTTKPVIVNRPTPLTITPSPIVRICPDCSPPTVLNTNSSASFNAFQWYQNGAIITPNGTNATYPLCNFNASGSYYVTATSSNNTCPVKSDTVQVIYRPKPLADIQGQSAVCVGSTGPYLIPLQNNETVTNPAYTYNWTGTGPSVPTFIPNATQFKIDAQVSVLGTYQFILTVTDTAGCIARDTLCVTLYPTPSVFITVLPSGNLCAGTMYTLTANPSPAPSATVVYAYQWSSSATTQSIITGQPGSYYVSVTNTETGCSAKSSSIIIKRQPYLDLFPIGCDTLCDTSTVLLIPPLPLGTNQTTYTGIYSIQWYETGATSPFFTGSPLLASSLSLGQHHIYIIVTDIATGCKDTSGVYDLFIKNCSDCCPYNIRVDSSTIQYNYTQIPNATVLTETFSINGLNGVNIKEVRANVVSYTITDNYNKECMKCINMPFTWASVASASNLVTIPPKITMYNGLTVLSFNGSGAGVYQNPREIVWNNGTNFNIPNGTLVPIKFILPPVPTIDCCQLQGRICVKFTFRDEDCKECEVIKCFSFVIKK